MFVSFFLGNSPNTLNITLQSGHPLAATAGAWQVPCVGDSAARGYCPISPAELPLTRDSPAAPQTTSQDDPTQRAAPVGQLDVLHPGTPGRLGR